MLYLQTNWPALTTVCSLSHSDILGRSQRFGGGKKIHVNVNSLMSLK